MSDHILARPEDVLLAAVAYTRPQMLALDDLISPSNATLALPTELLLHIRAHLQSLLVSQLADEAAASLFEYESALVEGLCPDCYWWNTDIYGTDVWAWVEHGYRGACACVVAGETAPASTSSPSTDAARSATSRPRSVSDLMRDHDPRKPSLAKRRILATFTGVDIENRGQWLRAYVSRTYFDGKPAWATAKGILADLGCSSRFERTAPAPPPPSSQPQLTAVNVAVLEAAALALTNAETPVAVMAPPSTMMTPVAMHGADAHGPSHSETKNAMHRPAPRPCDFGAFVRIIQAPARPASILDEEPAAVTLSRLARELCLRPLGDVDDSEEPRIPLECAYNFTSPVCFSRGCS